MATPIDTLTLDAQVQAIMDELGVDREAAALLAAVRNGVALVDDVVIEPVPEPHDRTDVATPTVPRPKRHAKVR